MGDTLTVWAGRYLDHLAVERGLSANTLAAYRRDLRRYVAFCEKRDIVRRDGRRRGDRPVVRRLHLRVDVG